MLVQNLVVLGARPPGFVRDIARGIAIYGNIYHQYTPNVSIYIYTIHGSYGVKMSSVFHVTHVVFSKGPSPVVRPRCLSSNSDLSGLRLANWKITHFIVPVDDSITPVF